MANIKQQKKRIITAQRQRNENLRYRSTIKTLFNRLQLNVDTGDKDAAAKTHAELVSLVDRAIAHGALHRNTAARKKARASRMLLQEAKTDATTIRKAKKKTAPVKKKPVAKKPAAEKKPAAKKPAAKKADEPKAEKPAAEVEAPETEVIEETPAAEEAAAPEAEATPAAEDAPAEDAKED
jgi:small subunit ribosomal protein S20